MDQQSANQPEFKKQRQHPIDEGRQIESQLQAERDFARAILNTVDTLIIVIDRNGRIVRFNHACETLTGYSFNEVKNKLFWDLFLIPEEKPLVEAIFAKLITDHIPNKSENYWITKNGRRVLISWSSTILFDANHNVEYIVSAGNDMTERKQIALLLNASVLHRVI